MGLPTAVVQVEGVLRKTVTGALLDSGKRLYYALAASYNIVLVTEETDREHFKYWLSMEAFDQHGHIVYGDSNVPREDARWVAVAKMLKLSYGFDIEYIVQPDPVSAAQLIERGFNSLLVTNAAYALPEWRPEARGKVRPWEELMAEVAHQQKLRAADKRMEGSEF